LLVLTRKEFEEVVIGDDIVVSVVEIRGDKVRLGISAPKEVSVHRKEIYLLIHPKPAQSTTTALTPEQQKGASNDGDG